MYQKKVSWVVTGFLLLSLFVRGLPLVNAAQSGSVVINEVAWAGSADSANDEWIELYNPSPAAVDVSGWTINDDHGASVYHLNGTIPSHGYYVVEDAETVIQPLVASGVVNVSLANSGDSLTLLDAQAMQLRMQRWSASVLQVLVMLFQIGRQALEPVLATLLRVVRLFMGPRVV
jgi:hypothetical protein